MIKKYLIYIILLCLASCASVKNNVVLFHDDFSKMHSEKISSDGGAHTEYHFLPELYGKGNWNVASFYHDRNANVAWKVFSDEGKKIIAQTTRYKILFTHPMLVAGDSLWEDYTASLRFKPLDELQSGLVFRYHTNTQYYFFGVEKGMALLKKADKHKAFRQENVQVLASQPFDYKPGEYLNAVVNVNGSNITATINNSLTLKASDASYKKGKVALLADAPTYFTELKVVTSAAQHHQIAKSRTAILNDQAALSAKNPKMKLWKKLDTDGFGTGRSLRFGDLDGDGQLDILVGQVMNLGPTDKFSEVSCLTAITMDGKKLWQVGEPDTWKTMLTNDVAFQIHDINGDGKNEVIYAKGREIIVAEGATGKALYKKSTPRISDIDPKGPVNKEYDHILGDAIFFADFRGLGRKGDMLIKDRYDHFWVMDENLNPLWHGMCKTGHYPYAMDMDNDGKDELAIGYTLYNSDGKQRWSLDKTINDHTDGVAIVDYKGDGNFITMNAASDEGMLFIDTKGNILKHHFIGHAQNPVVANFRNDLPGLETLTINFWGNQGIVNFYDADGNIYHDFEPAHHGSMCMPLNWKGDGEEYFILSPNPEIGGVFDGWGRKVMNFPDDGHPDMCNATLDITGDSRDEIVVWDTYSIWIYTQDDNPRKGRLYKPVKNSLSNYSNYQTTVSQPGWIE